MPGNFLLEEFSESDLATARSAAPTRSAGAQAPTAAPTPSPEPAITPEMLEKTRLDELPEVLRHTRLTQPGNLRQLGNAAFGGRAQNHEPNSNRIGKRLEPPQQTVGG